MTEGRQYTLHCEGLPPSPNRSMHHMERHKLWKGFRDELGWRARAAVTQNGGHEPFARAQVVITLHHKSARHLFDEDNSYYVAKPALDSLKGVLLVDDSPTHITLGVRQVVSGKRGMTIEVTERLV